MNGPQLTAQEAVASLARRVQRGEARGLDREAAVRLTAAETGIDPEKVRWSVETVFGAAPVRLSPPARKPRVTLAFAAAL